MSVSIAVYFSRVHNGRASGWTLNDGLAHSAGYTAVASRHQARGKGAKWGHFFGLQPPPHSRQRVYGDDAARWTEWDLAQRQHSETMDDEAKEAQHVFENKHSVLQGEVHGDAALYTHDTTAYQALLRAAPWRRDRQYFRRVRVSVIALLKMLLHARSGGELEVMGLMQGHVRGDTVYVIDVFALPVHGTETRVNAQNEAYEYMVMHLEASQRVHRLENAIGWYHSHPGYGCWLSGIDVQTQQTNQQQDPFIAVVIDPLRTMSSGHVDLGAFRTWPQDQEADDTQPMRQHIPASKMAEYGAHASKYYALDVQYFKNAADRPLYDQLWHKYWAQALCVGPSTSMSMPVHTQQAEPSRQPQIPPSLELQRIHELREQMQDTVASIRSTNLLPGGVSYAQTARTVPGSADIDLHALAQQLEKRANEQPLGRVAHQAAAMASSAHHALEQERRRAMLFG